MLTSIRPTPRDWSTVSPQQSSPRTSRAVRLSVPRVEAPPAARVGERKRSGGGSAGGRRRGGSKGVDGRVGRGGRRRGGSKGVHTTMWDGAAGAGESDVKVESHDRAVITLLIPRSSSPTSGDVRLHKAPLPLAPTNDLREHRPSLGLLLLDAHAGLGYLHHTALVVAFGVIVEVDGGVGESDSGHVVLGCDFEDWGRKRKLGGGGEGAGRRWGRVGLGIFGPVL